MSKIYPESHVEISGFMARHYDTIMNLISMGKYRRLIREAIAGMNIERGDHILDLGCGTGRNACIMLEYLGDSGRITGVDLSPVMARQFRDKCRPFDNVEFLDRRIDIPCDFDTPFDKVFMSFVLHGFPHEIRQVVLRNIVNALKPGGVFCLFDFGRFSVARMPILHRWIFKTVECRYAWDFVERDWREILESFGLVHYRETFWFHNYIRLLQAVKQ